ncbi:hypothetical protein K8I28_07945 [bacterium]|nr:hypothetical protein [bacterium]
MKRAIFLLLLISSAASAKEVAIRLSPIFNKVEFGDSDFALGVFGGVDISFRDSLFFSFYITHLSISENTKFDQLNQSYNIGFNIAEFGINANAITTPHIRTKIGGVLGIAKGYINQSDKQVHSSTGLSARIFYDIEGNLAPEVNPFLTVSFRYAKLGEFRNEPIYNFSGVVFMVGLRLRLRT